MTTKSIHLRQFCSDEIFFSDEEVRQILIFFFPEDQSRIAALVMTHPVRNFAQGIVLAAVDSSHDLSILKKLMNLIYRKHTSIGPLLRKLAKDAPREWFKHMKGPGFTEPKVAEPVRLSYSRNFRRVFILIISGADVSESSCLAFINPDQLHGARILWG